MSAHRAAPHWLLATIGAVLCVCLIATTVRASSCQRAQRLLETATAAIGETRAPATSSTLDAAPLDASSGGPQVAHGASAKSCASSAFVRPVIATSVPVIGAHVIADARLADRVPHVTSSGIERPPRRS